MASVVQIVAVPPPRAAGARAGVRCRFLRHAPRIWPGAVLRAGHFGCPRSANRCSMLMCVEPAQDALVVLLLWMPPDMTLTLPPHLATGNRGAFRLSPVKSVQPDGPHTL